MSKVRTDKDGFTYEMSIAEAEEKFYGDTACEFGTPKPKGMWESLLLCSEYPEQVRKEYLANHCYSPLIRELIQNSMRGSDN